MIGVVGLIEGVGESCCKMEVGLNLVRIGLDMVIGRRLYGCVS